MFDAPPDGLKLHTDWFRVVLLCLLFGARPASGTAVTVYATDFETNEGYSADLAVLAGQNGWVSFGSGGNGVVTGFVPGHDQSAYIGYDAPVLGNDFLSVWQPFNFHPGASNTPVVVFSVLAAVVPSDNGQSSAFYWSVYNAQTNRLFVLDFDNATSNIFYSVSGTNDFLQSAGWTFQDNVVYPLVITMNFASNRWNAVFDSVLIVTNQPITTGTNELSLGAVAAEWSIPNANAPGDDYLLFNDYQITAAPIPAPLLRAAVVNGTNVSIRVSSETNFSFVVESSPNLLAWSALDTNVTAAAGFFDFIDANAVALPARYYRARWVP